MKNFLIAIVFISVPALAAADVFTSYESARQALIRGSVAEVKTAAKQLGAEARTAKAPKVAELAAALERAADLKAARVAFASLSDEMIKYRQTRSGKRPVVAYCDMERKSWLQPDGEIGNPYVDAGMRKCGEIKAR